MLWFAKVRFCKFWNRITLCFVLWEIFLQTSMFTLFAWRPLMFSGGKIFSITNFSSVNTLNKVELTSVNGGPLFLVFPYSLVRFSRYSVSADESSACKTVESFRTGLGGFSSWGKSTPWDVTVWLDWKIAYFVEYDESSALLKIQWPECSEKFSKHYQNMGQDLRGYYCLFPEHHYWLYLSHRFSSSSSKFFSISSGLWTVLSIILERNVL